MPDWTNWTDKQDAEVLDRVYRMRPNGTMSVVQTGSITCSPDIGFPRVVCLGQSIETMGEWYERP